MLDDCAGDRFEELLAIFSTIVLRKVVLAEGTEHGGVARRLATADHISVEEHKLILPLISTHRASLATLLRKKKLLKSRYRDLSRTLESKSTVIVKESEQLNAELEKRASQDEVGASEVEALTRQVREGWLGEAAWATLVIGGKSQCNHDTILDSTFADAFIHAKSGDLGSVQGHRSIGLLEDLESRLSKQQERLTRWGQFRDDLRKKAGPPEQYDPARDAGRSTRKMIKVLFQDHQHLLPGAVIPGKRDASEVGQVSMDGMPQLPASIAYDHFVERMQEKLVKVSRPTGQGSRSRRKTREDTLLVLGKQTPTGINDPTSKLDPCAQDSVSSIEDSKPTGVSEYGITSNKQDHQPGRGCVEIVSAVDGQQDVDLKEAQPSMARTDFDNSSTSRPRIRDNMFNSTFTTNKTSLPILPAKHSHYVRTSPSEEADPELLAEAIIASVVEAAPTPAKPKLSLLERTRMSMALSSSDNTHQTPMGPPVQPASDTEATPKPRKGLREFDQRSTLADRTRESIALPDSVPRAPDPDATPKPLRAPMTIDRSSTLLERTRQSMSMLPATSNRTRKSNYNLRFSRGFPVNQFETPRKQQSQGSDEKRTASTSMPPEELFSEADYATVFKSRPKIAVSPTVSLSLDSDPSLLLDGVTELAGSDGVWGSSPLTRVR